MTTTPVVRRGGSWGGDRAARPAAVDVVITFANGEKWSPATRLRFDQHTRSRVIDRPGAARTINRIDFYYRSIAGGRQGRAVVQAQGR